MTARIFISYRRDDTAGYARAVGDALGREFGADNVFLDVDDIDAGQTFDRALQTALEGCAVVVVLIGKRWRGERNGRPARLDEPGDVVRQEIMAALARGVPIIPLLVDGVPMPGDAQLPEPLRPLARWQAIPLAPDRHADDLRRLVAALRRVLGEPHANPPAMSPKRSRRLGLSVAVALLAALALAGGYALRGLTASTSAPPSGRPAVNGVWTADVVYDWTPVARRERFEFAGAGRELHGSASFLGVARGLEEGEATGEALVFVTRSSELAGDVTREALHRYRGRLADGELRLVMQTQGGHSAHPPIEIIARREPAAGR